MKKRILITGASGFVGRQVLKYLTTKDVLVTLVVREGKELLFANNPVVESIILTKDLFSETDDWWVNVLNRIDTIIHLAWYVEPGKYLDAPQNIDCLIGTLNLAKGATRAGVRRFIGVGTCFEYDLSTGTLTVETRLKPLTPYASAKAALYIALSSWLTEHSIEFSWCRLFYLYGEGEHEHRLAPYVHKQIQNEKIVELTSGKQIRDYLDVSEAGARIAEIALGIQTGSINICSGNPISVREFVEKIADGYGAKHLLKFDAIPDRANDPPFVVGVQ
jgi:dTDP-6-deoxy-L-talose 4-dehydrogenase (NAD+)